MFIVLGWVVDFVYEKGFCDRVSKFSFFNIISDNCFYFFALILDVVIEVKIDIYVISFGSVLDVEMVSEF